MRRAMQATGGKLALALITTSVLAVALSACGEAPKPPPPPAAEPPKAPPPAPSTAADAGSAKPKMVANPDGLSLAERIAKRQATEAKVAADLDKLRGSLGKPIEAAAKKMATIDPKGGNSNITTDYDVMLNALANDYPAAIALSFEGDKAPLAEQTTELDNRSKKIEGWLAELGGGGKGKAGKPGKKKK